MVIRQREGVLHGIKFYQFNYCDVDGRLQYIRFKVPGIKRIFHTAKDLAQATRILAGRKTVRRVFTLRPPRKGRRDFSYPPDETQE